MKKKTIVGFALVVVLVFGFSVSSYTQSYRRNITAWFNNIGVELDGEILPLDKEPFIFENTLFMPIEELTDHLLINYTYDEKARLVKLNTNRLFDEDPVTSVVPVAFQRHYELEALRRQVAELQEELQYIQDGRFPYQRINTVAEMEKYLKDNFKQLGDLKIDFRFIRLSNDKYSLNVAFSNSVAQWQALDRRTIENWVDDILYVTRKLFNSKAEIQGNIRANHISSGTIYASYYTRGNQLYFDFRLAEHKKSQAVDGEKIEKALNQTLKHYNSEVFNYQVFVNNSDIDVIINAEKKYFNNWTPATKMQYLKRLRTEIHKINSNVNIDGRIIDEGSGKTLMRFSIVDSVIRSADLALAVEEYLNKNYKTFTYGQSHTFTYKVYETYSNAFEIVIEGSFADGDTQWQNVKNNGEYSLRMAIQNAFRYVDSIYDVDIFGELVDKNLKSICNLEYYREYQYQQRTLLPIIFQ